MKCTPTAEALQKELDQRYIRSLREATKNKTTVALRAWWEAAQMGSNVASSQRSSSVLNFESSNSSLGTVTPNSSRSFSEKSA